MRTRKGNPRQTVEMRAPSCAMGGTGGGGLLDWGGALSSCVGGTIIAGPFVAAASSVTVIDNSMDWRDRVIFVVAHLKEGFNNALPGDTNEFYIYQKQWNNVAEAWYFFNGIMYTAKGGDGSTRGGAGNLQYSNPLKAVDLAFNTDLSLYAHSTTGNLVVKETGGQAWSGIIFMIVTEQTGKRSTVP